MTDRSTSSRLTQWPAPSTETERTRDMSDCREQVVLAGSMSALSVMSELAQVLESHGVKAIVPAPDDDPTVWTLEAMHAVKRRASRAHISHIRDERTAALLVANLDREGSPNYIGPNTFAEIAIAFADNRPVYLLQGIPNQYEDELLAWGVECLFGDVVRMITEVAREDSRSASSEDPTADDPTRPQLKAIANIR